MLEKDSLKSEGVDGLELKSEIAESHPDMNIKVAAFTVSEKSSNTNILLVNSHDSLKSQFDKRSRE